VGIAAAEEEPVGIVEEEVGIAAAEEEPVGIVDSTSRQHRRVEARKTCCCQLISFSIIEFEDEKEMKR